MYLLDVVSPSGSDGITFSSDPTDRDDDDKDEALKRMSSAEKAGLWTQSVQVFAVLVGESVEGIEGGAGITPVFCPFHPRAEYVDVVAMVATRTTTVIDAPNGTRRRARKDIRASAYS